MSHIILDFETAGKALDGIVLNVAYTHFDTDTVEEIDAIIPRVQYIKFNYEEQEDVWEYDESVLAWWEKQNPKTIKEAFTITDDHKSISEFCINFSDYLHKHFLYVNKDSGIWSRGTSFDITILERLYKYINMDFPVVFWTVRDTRTFLDAVNIMRGCDSPLQGNIIGLKQNYIAHDPRHDIAKDIQQIQIAYKALQKCGG